MHTSWSPQGLHVLAEEKARGQLYLPKKEAHIFIFKVYKGIFIWRGNEQKLNYTDFILLGIFF